MTRASHVPARRQLHFRSMSDILHDVEVLNSQKIQTTGNWSPAQIVAHVNEFIVMSLDGFTFQAPRVLRAAGRLMRGYFLKKGFKPGIKTPPGADGLQPSSNISWDEALAGLRQTMQRLENGERMTRPSPIFGKMTHEQWEQLHCRHAELHFGFMHPMSSDQVLSDS